MSNREAFDIWFHKTINHEFEGDRNKGAYWFAWQAAIQHCMQGEHVAHLRSYSEDANNEDGRLEGFEVCTSHDIGSFPVFTHANPEIAELKRDAERWNKLLGYIGASNQFNLQTFHMASLPIPEGMNLIKGSVSQHLTKAIDDAISASPL